MAWEIIIGAIVAAVLSTAITYAVQKLTAVEPDEPIVSTRVNAFRTIQRDSAAPARIVYGETKTSGVLAFAQTCDETGVPTKNARYLHLCLLISEGPIDSLSEFELNDTPGLSARFAASVVFIPMLGGETQQPLGGGIEMQGKTVLLPREWTETSYRALAGIAYCWIIMRYDLDTFPSGAPQIRMKVRGKLVWDPRDSMQDPDDPSTWLWSNNQAICQLDYLRNGRYGMQAQLGVVDDTAPLGATGGNIDLNSFIGGANICDQIVEALPRRYADGSGIYLGDGDDEVAEDEGRELLDAVYEKRYTVDGVFETNTKRGDVMTHLSNAGASHVVFSNGNYVYIPGVPRAPSFHLTDNDVADTINVTPSPPRNQRINTVQAKFSNKYRDWLDDSVPIQSARALVAQDGNVTLAKELNLPFTSSPYTAQRLGQIFLRRNRKGRVYEYPAKLSALSLRPGDVGTFDQTHAGLVNQLIAIEEWRLESHARGLRLLMIEEDPDVYLWEPFGVTAITAFPRPTTLPDPFAIGPPSSVQIREEITVDPNGRRVPRFILTINPPLSHEVLVAGYRVTYKNVDDPTQSQQRVFVAVDDPGLQDDPVDLVVSGVRQGDYQFQVQTQNPSGVLSVAVSLNSRLTWRTLPPPVVRDLLVRPFTDGTVTASWRLKGVPPPDLRGYRVKYKYTPSASLTADDHWTDAELIQDIATKDGQYTFRTPPLFRQSGWYELYVRALDDIGDESNGQTMVPPEASSTAVASFFVDMDTSSQGLLLYEADPADRRWPGEIINASITRNNVLEAHGGDSWASASTWETLGIWARVPLTMHYTDEIVDFGRNRDIVVTMTPHLVNGESNERMRQRLENGTWSEWHDLYPVTARYVQVRISVKSAGLGLPSRLYGIRIAIHEHVLEERVEDFAVAALPTHQEVSYRDRAISDWRAGDNRFARFTQIGKGYAMTPTDWMMEFAGSNGIIVAPDAAHIDLRTALTVELTFRTDNPAQTDKPLVMKGTAWKLALNNDTIVFSGAGLPTVPPMPLFGDAFTFRHIAVVFTTTRVRLYLDGTPKVTLALTDIELTTNSTPLSIMGNDGGTVTAHGVISEVRLWSLGRSDDQVREGVSGSFSGQEDGLSAYYKINEGTGTAIIDHSKWTNNAGVIPGGDTWIKACTRVTPFIASHLIRSLEQCEVLWTAQTASGGSIVVQMRSLEDGSLNAWTTVTDMQVLIGVLSGLTAHADLMNIRLQARIYLRVPSGGAAILHEFVVRFLNAPKPWDFVYVPGRKFVRIDSAAIVGVQNTTSIILHDVVAKARYGVRFRLEDIRRIGLDPPLDPDALPVLDILLRGIGVLA